MSSSFEEEIPEAVEEEDVVELEVETDGGGGTGAGRGGGGGGGLDFLRFVQSLVARTYATLGTTDAYC